MKSIKKIFFVLIAVLSVSATNPTENKFTLAKDFNVTILGTSNLHNWNEKVEGVTGNCSVTWNSDGTFDLNSFNLTMAVRSIKSDMGSAMNNNTYKALKADDNPTIIFALAAPVQSIKTVSTISAKGKLTIAGVTKPITMHVKVSIQNRQSLSFEGVQIIKMTDYGVSPPTALFGTLKTGDDITIDFKTKFTPN